MTSLLLSKGGAISELVNSLPELKSSMLTIDDPSWYEEDGNIYIMSTMFTPYCIDIFVHNFATRPQRQNEAFISGLDNLWRAYLLHYRPDDGGTQAQRVAELTHELLQELSYRLKAGELKLGREVELQHPDLVQTIYRYV